MNIWRKGRWYLVSNPTNTTCAMLYTFQDPLPKPAGYHTRPC